MPRSSTLFILLASIVLAFFGIDAALPAGIAMAMTLELLIWKAEADRKRALQLARVARPVRRQRGYR